MGDRTMAPTISHFVSDRRCWLLALTAILAVVLGFRSFSDSAALMLVSKTGFWFVLVTFVIWLRALWQSFAPDFKRLTWASIDWTAALVVVAGGIVLLSHEEFGFKIIMDEIMLLGTSMSMHLDKEVLSPIRGHDINGAFVILDGMLDKRPLFFSFLVSLLHDVFGYRPENAFVLNAGLTFVFLGLVFVAGRMLAGRGAACLGVILFAGLPLLGHNSTGGGFELLNITMILAAVLLGARWLEKRDSASLVAFCFTGLLLAQVRYESALFLLPVAFLMLFVWQQEGRAILPWPILFAPLLMVHLPLHHRVFQLKESAWEMFSKPGYSEPFSLTYIPENLQHALAFFFGSASEQPNSIVLSALGVIAFPFFCLLALKRVRSLRQESPVSVSVTIFTFGLAVHFMVLMCYFWGKFDEPIIRRLSLPTHVALVLAIVAILPQFRSPRVIRVLLIVAVLAMVGRSIPAMAAHAYSQAYLPGREVAWRREFMKAQPRADYLMIDNDSSLWLTHRVSAIPTLGATKRREDIAFHMRNRTFSTVYVFQRIEINPETGEQKLREGDDLGAGFVLEPVTEERLQLLTISRISRVKEIRTEQASISAEVPIGPKSTQSRAELDRARKLYYENYMKQLP
jgi:hypothetical protein